MRYDADENVWLTRSNISEWVITDDGTPLDDLSSLSRAVICVGSDTVDSDVDGSSVIWWTDSVTSITLPDGTSYTGDVLRSRMGKADLTVGEHEDCRIVVYDTDYPDGLVVTSNMRVTVYAACGS